MGTQSRASKDERVRIQAAAKPPQEDSARERRVLQARPSTSSPKRAFTARGCSTSRARRARPRQRYMRATPSKEALFEALMAWSTRQGTDALDAIAADETARSH